MKKFLALLITSTILLGLTACGGNGTTTTATTKAETKPNGSASQASSENGTSATGAKKLKVWCWDPAFNIYAMKEAEKVYQETNPDFELEIVEMVWDDVQTKLTTAATSGKLDTLPDIILMQDNAFQKNHANYPEVFVDLTDSGVNFSDFAEAKVEYSVVDGKNYGVPFDNGASIMALRLDVLEQAGLTLEDFTDITWDKYIELGEQVLAKTKQPLMSNQAGTPDLIMQMLQSCGSSLFKEDGTTNIVGNKALEEAVRVYVELVKKGVMVEVNDWDQYIGTVNNSTVAGTIQGCWIIGSLQIAEDQSGKWGITNIPKLDGIEKATNYSNNGGSSWLVTSNCKDTELAFDFFNKTYAGSVPFYETILPVAGALTTWLPAAEGAVYAEPSVFFNNQKVFLDITDFASKVPKNVTDPYYYEARDTIGVALTNIIFGADVASELKTADESTQFQMQG